MSLRMRLLAVLSCACAAGAFAVGAGAATHTVDATFLCHSDVQGGVNLFKLDVDTVDGSGLVLVWSADVQILAPFRLPQTVSAQATTAQRLDGKLDFEPKNCARVPRKVPLARGGLPLVNRFAGVTTVANCWIANAYFRERVTFDSKKRAIRTTVAMANRTGKPLAFLEVEPSHATVYAAPGCRN